MPNPKDIELVLNAIRNKRSHTFMKSLFRTINKSYRECIDRAQDRLAVQIEGPASTITLTQLKDSLVAGETVITELDMVDNVFGVIKAEIARTVRQHGGPHIGEYQYFLSIVMAYAQSLLGYLIYPHRRLQMFLFDLCIDSNNLSTLQQLINFHVILDTPDLLERLTDLLTGGPSWIGQILLDVAKRMQRTNIVVETLFHLDRSMEIVEYIQKNDPGFEIEQVFNLMKKFPQCNSRSDIWKQIELWNIMSNDDVGKPVLSHQVVMMNSSP